MRAVADDCAADEELVVAGVLERAGPYERRVVAVAEDGCGEVDWICSRCCRIGLGWRVRCLARGRTG